MARPKKMNEEIVKLVELEMEADQQNTTITPVSQVKLAVSIPGTTTQTLMAPTYALDYDSAKQVLYVQKKGHKDIYVVHSSNVAYIKL